MIASAQPVFSQSTNPTVSPQRGQINRTNFLNLTPEQQTQINQIRQNERSQIDAILTAEQKAQLQRERENRKSQAGENQTPATPRQNEEMRRTPFASLNLTDEQRTQIETVHRAAMQQMETVLTPEQRQKLQEFQQQRQQRRQGNSQTPQTP